MDTCSFAFPNMFDVAKNTAAIVKDKESILSRIRLLLLTEPTEMYGEPDFGVGLRGFLFRYNTDNILPEMRGRIITQLSKWEPDVIAERTELERNVNSEESISNNSLNLTLVVYTVFGDQLAIDLSQYNTL